MASSAPTSSSSGDSSEIERSSVPVNDEEKLSFWQTKLSYSKEHTDLGDAADLNKWAAALLQCSRFQKSEPQKKTIIHEAIDKLEKALQVSDGNDKTLFLLGVAHSSLGDNEKAVGYFKEAHKKNPEERLYKVRSYPDDYTWNLIGALIWCSAVAKIILKK